VAYTISDLLDEWWDFRSHDFAPTTQATTQHAIAKLKAEFGPLNVDALKPRHVEQWVARCRADGMAPRTIRRVAGVLSTAYQLGLRWEIVLSNPVAVAELPRITPTVKAPSVEVVRKALEASNRNPKLHCFIRLAAVTGARRSELLALRCDDFDPDIGTITIRKAHIVAKGEAVTVDRTKTARGSRVVAVDTETCEILEKYLSNSDSPWIFPGKDPARPMYPMSVTHEFNKLSDRIGARLTPHMLRHYAATHGLAAGTPLPVLAARLGDAPGTIMAVYCSAIGSDDRAAADVLANTIDGPSSAYRRGSGQ
jgi:integrase